MAGISHQRGCFLKPRCLKNEFGHFSTLSGVVINFNSNLHEELIGVKEWHLPYFCHEQYAMRKQSALTSDRHPRIDINVSNEHEAVGFLGAKPDPFVVVFFFLFFFILSQAEGLIVSLRSRKLSKIFSDFFSHNKGFCSRKTAYVFLSD